MRVVLGVLAWVSLVACSDDPKVQPDTADAVDTADAAETSPETSDDVAPEIDSADTSDVAPDSDTREPDPAQPPDRNEARPAASGALRVGVATLPLDAPVGISMGGYGARSGPSTSSWSDLFFASTGSHGSLLLKSIAFDVGGERMVIVKLPLPFSEDTLTHEMTTQLQARHGLDLAGRVITAATHTHHGPARFWRLPGPLGIAGIDTPDAQAIRIMAGKMADVVAMAIADLDLAEWGYVTTDDWDPDDHVYRDRRNNNDARWGKDPRLTVLGARRLDGTPIVAMANFAMHGTILGSNNALLSEDAAGGFEEGLEAALYKRHGRHVVGMFTQAAGGDAAPGGDWLGHNDEQRMWMIGHAAPGAVLSAWDRITWRSDAELAVRSRLIGAYHGWIYGDSHEFDNSDGEPIRFGTVTCTIDPVEGISQQGEPKECGELEELFPLFGESLPDPELNQLYMTVGRLGPLYLMSIPGEPTYSLMQYAREAFAAAHADADLLVLGYSQDHMLYFTHPDDWYLGEYEAEFSVWGPWAGKWLVDRQLAMIAAMRAGNNAPTYYEEIADFSKPLSPDDRTIEPSIGAGTIALDAPATIERMDVLDFVVSGGDPVYGMPRFELQRADGSPVTNASGGVSDNKRLDTITRYAPIPAASEERIPRDHRWMWRWQVPPDLPTGGYRVIASGRAFADGDRDWTTTSRTFVVLGDDAATLTAAPIEGGWLLRWTAPPEPIVKSDGNREPLRGLAGLRPDGRPQRAHHREGAAHGGVRGRRHGATDGRRPHLRRGATWSRVGARRSAVRARRARRRARARHRRPRARALDGAPHGAMTTPTRA
jgi:hypothetical protein